MQVLVLAVQNAVEYRFMGVATSGSTLFRQIGGSIGVALFGAIFANRLHANLAGALPGVHAADDGDPAAVQHLPPAVHDAYVHGVRRLAPAGLPRGAALGVVAFPLTWLLREVPLRKTTGAGETAGETFGLEEARLAPREEIESFSSSPPFTVRSRTVPVPRT